jgi:hypothetical protein
MKLCLVSLPVLFAGVFVQQVASADEVSSADGREVATFTAHAPRAPRPVPVVVAHVSVCDGAMLACSAPIALRTAPSVKVVR